MKERKKNNKKKKKKRRKVEDEGRPTKKALTNIDDTTMVPKT